MADAKQRTFTIAGSEIGFQGGSYRGASPYNAAKKAARQLFRAIDNGVKYTADPKGNAALAKFAPFATFKKQKLIKFLLREKTRGSDKETYYYDAMQTELDSPKTFERNGVQITVDKKVSIKTCTDGLSALKF